MPYTVPTNWRFIGNQDNMHGWVKVRVAVPEAWVGKDLLLYDWNFDET